MERTTAPSLAAIRSNPLATALALALGVLAGVAAAASDPVQPSNGFGQVGGDAGAQMRRQLANHPGAVQASKKHLGDILVVTDCGDDGSSGTLRNLIGVANEGDTIDMAACATIALDGLLLISQDNLTLTGEPTDDTTLEYAPTGDFPFGVILHEGTTGALRLQDVHLHFANKEGSLATPMRGGCIQSNGTVYLYYSVVHDCRVNNNNGDVQGGAIYAEDAVRIIGSYIHDNQALAEGGAGVTAAGGAVYTPGFAVVETTRIVNNAANTDDFSWGGGLWVGEGAEINNAEISGNLAVSAGGMVILSELFDNHIVIASSTISGNESYFNWPSAGAWLHAVGDTIALSNNTITGNVIHDTTTDLDNAAGLAMGTGADAIELKSNIISGNLLEFTTGGAVASDFDPGNGATVTGGDNLIGFIDAGFSAIPSDTIRQYQTPLGPLQDNGGPTWTHALATGSWAFNLGSFFLRPEYIDGDQRGFPREVGAGVDIGAFESDALFIGRFEDPPTSP